MYKINDLGLRLMALFFMSGKASKTEKDDIEERFGKDNLKNEIDLIKTDDYLKKIRLGRDGKRLVG